MYLGLKQSPHSFPLSSRCNAQTLKPCEMRSATGRPLSRYLATAAICVPDSTTEMFSGFMATFCLLPSSTTPNLPVCSFVLMDYVRFPFRPLGSSSKSVCLVLPLMVAAALLILLLLLLSNGSQRSCGDQTTTLESATLHLVKRLDPSLDVAIAAVKSSHRRWYSIDIWARISLLLIGV